MFYIGRPDIDDSLNLARALRRGRARAIQAHFDDLIEQYAAYERARTELWKFQALDLDEDASDLIRNLFDRMDPGGGLFATRTSLLGRARICPYCRISEPFQLDHFLPKESFPELAIYSQNLVPVCARCNGLKGANTSAQFVHSYYDNLPREQYLVADIELHPGAVQAIFRIDTSGMTRPLATKVINHFNSLLLSERYEMQAAERIDAYAEAFAVTFPLDGVAGVKEDLRTLRRMAEGLGPNYWEVVLISALLDTPEYLNGGFRGL